LQATLKSIQNEHQTRVLKLVQQVFENQLVKCIRILYFYKSVLKLGVEIVLSSDAYHPDHVGY